MPEDAIPGSDVRATTKHGALTVDEIGDLLPGTSRLMDELGRRYWTLYYAAKAGNWALARYMEHESEKLLAILARVRPKYAVDLDAFTKDSLGPLAAAIETKDWTAFDAAFRRSVGSSDVYHAKYNKGFIRFRLPVEPPSWLELEPR